MMTLQNQFRPDLHPQSNYRPAAEVTPRDIAGCRTRTALALLLHLRLHHSGQMVPIIPEIIGQQMAPCTLSSNAVRLALSRLVEAGLVEVLEACPLPRRSGAGRPITHLYLVRT